MYLVVNGFFQVVQLAVLVRVLYSWVDQNPYPTNAFKRVLWSVTDPILEPLRRIIPPLGMFDISPLVALILVQVVHRAVIAAIFPYGPGF
jgi:YggT family protein